MKKMGLITTMLVAGGMATCAYILTNKSTSKKANQLINTMLDDANNVLKK